MTTGSYKKLRSWKKWSNCAKPHPRPALHLLYMSAYAAEAVGLLTPTSASSAPDPRIPVMFHRLHRFHHAIITLQDFSL
ncbi:hypothetical protein GGX14DRAFT_553679 [Mycena pura]|uniref:Uncharacterized protein n=1 Tax=Mycena pura TaxID=153505 RepID=A0AAD6YV85_9AGAR|nr:hypothetical protein GGX14DRAFT_553679 [Mycena pura]